MNTAVVSVYRGMRVENGKEIWDTTGVVCSIDSVVRQILDGSEGLDEKTRMCNILARTDDEKYKEYKKTLGAVTWSGTFSKERSNV